jgi:hypothetical protein
MKAKIAALLRKKPDRYRSLVCIVSPHQFLTAPQAASVDLKVNEGKDESEVDDLLAMVE